MRSPRSAAGMLGAVLLAAAACSQKPASIDISEKKVTIYGVEHSRRLTAQVRDKKGQPVEQATASWASSNAEVAAAEPGGRIVAKMAGRAMITASYESLSAKVPVEVIDVATIEMSAPAISLVGPVGTSVPLTWTVKDSHGKTVDLKPGWSSSNPKVATVSEAGVVTSVAPGTATIIASVGDTKGMGGKRETGEIQGGCDVTVTLRPIARIELRPATALARVGEIQHFEVVAYGPDGAPIPEVAAVFRSSDSAVASVDGAGVATGHKAGAAKIRVELAGQFAEATLLVN
ncbi:MAG TPA: Ig-like domain-containing protein [Thermoanaerobaculia bacterium]|jgi:uncharacterized protein YjdB|nr:Ig-like domain-containing protein [Thermoanaerobaculia bacterium]